MYIEINKTTVNNIDRLHESTNKSVDTYTPGKCPSLGDFCERKPGGSSPSRRGRCVSFKTVTELKCNPASVQRAHKLNKQQHQQQPKNNKQTHKTIKQTNKTNFYHSSEPFDTNGQQSGKFNSCLY